MGTRHDWAGIERAVRVERLRPSQIARRFGVPLSTFYYRARGEGWPLPLDRPAGRNDASEQSSGRALLTRLTRVALKRLIELEQGAGAASPEAAVKAVEGVLKLLERIETLEAAGGGQQPRSMTPEEKEQTRKRLAAQVLATLARIRGEKAGASTKPAVATAVGKVCCPPEIDTGVPFPEALTVPIPDSR